MSPERRNRVAALKSLACDGRVTLAVEAAGMPGEDGQHRVDGSIRSLVLRAWLESGAAPGLRIRIVEIDPGLIERPAIVTASVDHACKVVRRWLETLQSHDPVGPQQ